MRRIMIETLAWLGYRELILAVRNAFGKFDAEGMIDFGKYLLTLINGSRYL
ncbi:MAG: hypothetical protein JXL84_13130 [Deltaproteobacteria bacterium]|nr:hypothetical protein [Deltaproteobacteria bacterium]